MTHSSWTQVRSQQDNAEVFPLTVSAALEATEFEYSTLYHQHSIQSVAPLRSPNYSRILVRWEPNYEGVLVLLEGPIPTTIRLRFRQVVFSDGGAHSLLFWNCVSRQADFGLAEGWIRDNFKDCIHSGTFYFNALLDTLSRLPQKDNK